MGVVSFQCTMVSFEYNGYLLDFDIYCGKTSNKNAKLVNCALGSSVIMQMLERVLSTLSPRKMKKITRIF